MKSAFSSLLCISFIAVAACSKSPNGIQNSIQSNGIVGGEVVTPEAKAGAAVLRSTVALAMNDGGSAFAFCTGTLIAPDLVLTAAHCSKRDASTLKVFFGANFPQSMNDANMVQVAKIARNPEYDSSFGSKSDVALLKLEKPAPAGYAPVAILEPSYTLNAGQEILLAGWGLIQDVPEQLDTDKMNMVRIKIAGIEGNIVVTDQNGGHGACSGDSGGPAYLETPNELIVFGDTRGPHKGSVDCDHFGEYTYSSNFKDFILKAASDLGATAPTFKVPN